MLEMPKVKVKRSIKKSAAPEKAALPNVEMDYPQGKEVVSVGHYAVRLSAAGETHVELSVDGSAWSSCRFSAGYYWFDWYPTKAGDVELKFRAKSKNKDWSEPATRTIRVKK
jgi:hypothetical protein